MNDQYVITIKNERAGSINTMSILIALMSAVFFLIPLFSSFKRTYLFLVASMLIAGGLVWNRYHLQKTQRPVFYTWILVIAGIAWLFMPFLPWIGVPIMMLAFLEKRARLPLAIRFTKEEIVFNNLFRKNFSWNEFNNIVLKDGVITLDFKSNRLFQKETVDKGASASEEIAFNQFCASRLD